MLKTWLNCDSLTPSLQKTDIIDQPERGKNNHQAWISKGKEQLGFLSKGNYKLIKQRRKEKLKNSKKKKNLHIKRVYVANTSLNLTKE